MSEIFAKSLERLHSTVDHLVGVVATDSNGKSEFTKARAKLDHAGFFKSLDLRLLKLDTDEPYDAAVSYMRYGVAHLLAAEAFASSDSEMAWYCLLRCQAHFGEAHVRALQRPGRKNVKQESNAAKLSKLDQAKAFVAQLLRNKAASMPSTKKWQDRDEAAMSIETEFADYARNVGLFKQKIQFRERLVSWIRDYDEIRAVFEANCDPEYLNKSRRRKEKKERLASQVRMLN